MNCNQLTLLLALLAAALEVAAQVDTTQAEPRRVEVDTRLGSVEGEKVGKSDGVNYPVEMRSPRKATFMSMALPGLGQAYNRKYWKIPILYGGIALTTYYLRDNLQNIDFYRRGLIADINGDITSPDYTGLPRQVLENNLDQYMQWRDLSYITFALIYILNIVDANVDAHLAYFDVSEDISFQVKPFWSPIAPLSPGLTLCLKL